MLTILFAVLLLIPGATFGATIYIDNTLLSTNCTSGNYSIANRNCSGSDGNAYNNIASALTASAAGDTVRFRFSATAYASNVADPEGIRPKAGQTWETHPGDLPNKATVTGVGKKRVFTWASSASTFVDNVTLRQLILRDTNENCVWTGGGVGTTLTDLECTNWNLANVPGGYIHGINFGSTFDRSARDNYVANNYVHDPANTHQEMAGLTWGGRDSNALVENNLVENVSMGYWTDVGGGDPTAGRVENNSILLLRHTVRNNIAHNVTRYAYHIEARSSWIMYGNVCVNCGQVAVFMRHGGTSHQVKIWNNTFYGWTVGGVHMNQGDAADKCQNCEVSNNIIFTTGSPLAYALTVGQNTKNDTSNVFRNNLFYVPNSSTRGVCWGKLTGSGFGCDVSTTYAATTTGISNFNSNNTQASGHIAGDPLFLNAAGGDFSLRSGSPAIDAGVNIGLSYTGSAPDIGALESGSPTAPPPPPPPAPPPASPSLAIPGRIEAEAFNTGGEGNGYHDTTSANLGGAYRISEAVDVKLASGGTGYTIGYIDSGEWLKYDVNVAQSGNYTITFRVANGGTTNGALRVEVDGVNVTGTISIPPTGSYSAETTVTGRTVSLSQGAHTLRAYMEAGNFDLNWLEFTSSSVSSAPAAPGNLVVGIQ